MQKSNNGYSKACNCSQGQYKWFNTLQAREFDSNSNLFYSRDNIPKWLVIYHLDVTLKQPLINNFKMTLEQMLLIGDSNKFLLKKYVTETHWNGLVISTNQLNNDRLFCDSLRGDLDRHKQGGEIAWVENEGGGDKKGWWEVILCPNCSY